MLCRNTQRLLGLDWVNNSLCPYVKVLGYCVDERRFEGFVKRPHKILKIFVFERHLLEISLSSIDARLKKISFFPDQTMRCIFKINSLKIFPLTRLKRCYFDVNRKNLNKNQDMHAHTNYFPPIMSVPRIW